MSRSAHIIVKLGTALNMLNHLYIFIIMYYFQMFVKKKKMATFVCVCVCVCALICSLSIILYKILCLKYRTRLMESRLRHRDFDGRF